VSKAESKSSPTNGTGRAPREDAFTRALDLATSAQNCGVAALIPSLTETVQQIAARLATGEIIAPNAVESDLHIAAQSDQTGLRGMLSALIAILVIDQRQSEGADRDTRVSTELVLGVTSGLAGDLLADNGQLANLSRWLAAGITAWDSGEAQLTADALARRILRLVSSHGSEPLNTILGHLSSTARVKDDLELLLGRRRTTDANLSGMTAPDGMLVVLSSENFQSLREALYKNSFRQVEGSPWPTATLDRQGSKSFAELRPAAMDLEPLLAPRTIEAWAATMWKQQSELSDLDADALDALCALYLNQAREADDTAVADVDEILAMRGLKPKRGGQGRRGGYEPEQRAEMLKALSHIQNIWINIAEVMVYEGAGKGRQAKRPVTKSLQSRPFIITDRMGQIRLDGYLEVERFIFRPGKAFAAFLFGSGRETGILFQKALQYDPFRRKWEKRLTRYISWHWRGASLNGDFAQTYQVQQLLDAVGERINERYPSKTRARLEQALEHLRVDRVLAKWSYEGWVPSTTFERGWAESWLDATIVIDAPEVIRTYYTQWRAAEPSLTEHAASARETSDIGERITRHRKMLGLSQQQAATGLGIRQGYFSKIERGKASPSPQLKRRIEAWLMEAG
jgi:DNA-binding XRE family transcriptional regulator